MTQCPCCSTPLRLVVERSVDIDVCDDCHGVWLDAGELDALAGSNDFAPRSYEADELCDLKCPRCATRDFATIKTNFGLFTRCAGCGGVFVGGETLDCISKSDRSSLSNHKTGRAAAMTGDVFSGVLEILWLFSRP